MNGMARPIARRGPLARGMAVVGLCLLLAACGSAPTTASHPTATATTGPQVRYTADWSHGLDGWQATPGWTVTNGALESSTGDGLALTVPYQPPSGSYAVEIDVQVVEVARYFAGFIFDVPASPTADGYQAGITGLRTPGGYRPNGDHPTTRTLITPLSDQNTLTNERAQTDFEPGDRVRTYRIEIDGPGVLLYVDGRFSVVATSTKPGPLAPGPLVLKVHGVHLRITGLRVLA